MVTFKLLVFFLNYHNHHNLYKGNKYYFWMQGKYLGSKYWTQY